MEEKNVWRGSPSHWVNFVNYLLSVLFLALFIATWVLAGKEIRSAGDVPPGADIPDPLETRKNGGLKTG